MIIVHLQPKKETPILNGHPWVFAGAIDKVDGAHPRQLCRVVSSQGLFVCQGFYNPYSQIAVRVLSLGKETIGQDFLARRIKQAIAMRRRIVPADTTCYRLVNAEGDGLPGLIADIYGDILVLQFLCLGMAQFLDDVVAILKECFPGHIIHERSDVKSRKAEGLSPQSGPLSGVLPEDDIEVRENGILLAVDVKTGERTGYPMDHRVNRDKLMRVAHDKTVLDLFAYSGGFALNALKGGARAAVSVDLSSPAQSLVKRNRELNGVSPLVWRHVKEDVLSYLNREEEFFDIVVCDMPPFAKPEEYTKVNTLAMARLKPGGLLFTAASYATRFGGPELLKAVNRAALANKRHAAVVEPLYQSPDYPFLSAHPEGVHMHGYMVYVA